MGIDSGAEVEASKVIAPMLRCFDLVYRVGAEGFGGKVGSLEMGMVQGLPSAVPSLSFIYPRTTMPLISKCTETITAVNNAFIVVKDNCDGLRRTILLPVHH